MASIDQSVDLFGMHDRVADLVERHRLVDADVRTAPNCLPFDLLLG